MLNILGELNKMTDMIGIRTACMGSIENQLFRVSHFNPAGIALTSFFKSVEHFITGYTPVSAPNRTQCIGTIV